LSAIVWLACQGLAGAVVNEWSTAGPANIHAIAEVILPAKEKCEAHEDEPPPDCRLQRAAGGW